MRVITEGVSMKGVNEFNLNEATMIGAMQFWLNSQWVTSAAPKVTSVKPDSKGGHSWTFILTVEGEG